MSTIEGSTVYRTLHQVPKVSTIEGFHSIQDTSDLKVSTIEGSTLYRTLHQVPKVSPIEGFLCTLSPVFTPLGVGERLGLSLGFGATGGGL